MARYEWAALHRCEREFFANQFWVEISVQLMAAEKFPARSRGFANRNSDALWAKEILQFPSEISRSSIAENRDVFLLRTTRKKNGHANPIEPKPPRRISHDVNGVSAEKVLATATKADDTCL